MQMFYFQMSYSLLQGPISGVGREFKPLFSQETRSPKHVHGDGQLATRRPEHKRIIAMMTAEYSLP